MKIKIFTYAGLKSSFDILENDVNDFIKNKIVISIQQSISPIGGTGGFLLVITVLYK